MGARHFYEERPVSFHSGHHEAKAACLAKLIQHFDSLQSGLKVFCQVLGRLEESFRLVLVDLLQADPCQETGVFLSHSRALNWKLQ